MSRRISNTVPRILRDKRRLIILQEIIGTDTKRKWSARAIAEACAEHPFFQENWPKYSKSTAHLDLVAIKEDITVTRRELADDYIKEQLEITGVFVQNLVEDWEELMEMQFPEPKKDEKALEITKQEFLSQQIADKVKIVTAMDRLFKRQGTLIPMEIPKQLQIEKRTFNLDMFLEMKMKHELEAGGENIIEGEFDEKEN